MIIKAIIDRNSGEGDPLVTDGVYECLVFSYPCDCSMNDRINEPLFAAFVTDFMLSYETDVGFEKLKEYYAYKIIAKVLDEENGLVVVGGIILEMEMGIPTWASEGDIVEFNCGRIDL